MSFVDIHSHFADPRFDSELDSYRKQVLEETRAAGITQLVQAGVGPEDWTRQDQLAKLYPELIPVFGLHPYWVKDHSEEECEQALDLLANELAKKRARPMVAIGEMGLDLRSAYKDCEGLQMEVFERQLELARFTNKPVVLHLVRAHEPALKILSLWGLPEAGGFVHSFAGSLKKAKDFMELNLSLSIGGALCHSQNKDLHEAVREIPLEKILLESDSPDQAPSGEGLNRPICILQVAEKIAELKVLKMREVLDRTSQNARKLLAL